MESDQSQNTLLPSPSAKSFWSNLDSIRSVYPRESNHGFVFRWCGKVVRVRGALTTTWIGPSVNVADNSATVGHPGELAMSKSHRQPPYTHRQIRVPQPSQRPLPRWGPGRVRPNCRRMMEHHEPPGARRRREPPLARSPLRRGQTRLSPARNAVRLQRLPALRSSFFSRQSASPPTLAERMLRDPSAPAISSYLGFVHSYLWP